MSTDFLQLFKLAASQWLCEPYSVEIRFIAEDNSDSTKLISCAVNFWPVGAVPSSSHRVRAGKVIGGKDIKTDMSQSELETLIANLESGKLVLDDIAATIGPISHLNFYSEMISNDRWFCDAHLIITGNNYSPLSSVETAKINSLLRLVDTPYDGLPDLRNQLNLPDAYTGYKASQIEIRICPPIDFRIDESSFSKGKLRLVIHAHPRFDTTKVSLAIRTFPESFDTRKQVASKIKWRFSKDRQIGRLNLSAKNSFAIQTILMAGDNTVRRHFFEDTQKAPNRRLFAVSSFDKDLKRLKIGLGDSNQDNFEKAVNSLAYLMGFSGSVMNESDAPDLVLSTPDENFVLIECTTRIADYATKVGKLVDRKNALLNMLRSANDSRTVHAYLVCGLPKAQIAHDELYLAKHRVTLLTKESIDKILDNLKFPHDVELFISDNEKKHDHVLSENNLH